MLVKGCWVSDWESIQADAQFDMAHEEIAYQEAIDKIVEEHYPSDEEIADQYSRTELYNKCVKVIEDYDLVNYFTLPIAAWDELREEDKLEYCKQLLKPIRTDSFPMERQVNTFKKLVNIDFYTVMYREILECALHDDVDEEINLKINFLIPQGYYKSQIASLYRKAKFKAISKINENTTESLQQLLEIWYLHNKGDNSYKIASKIVTYNAENLDKTQVNRSIKAIKLLIS